MKHTPIMPSGHIGCGCCSKKDQILSKDSWLDVGFGVVQLIIQLSNGQSIYGEYIGGCSEFEDEVPTVKKLEEEYKTKLDASECSTLYINAPLHDELYEYNKADGEWYLIKQGRGFA